MLDRQHGGKTMVTPRYTPFYKPGLSVGAASLDLSAPKDAREENPSGRSAEGRRSKADPVALARGSKLPIRAAA